MAHSSPRIASGLCLVGSGLFRSPHVLSVSKQINSAPYRFSASDSCRCLCASVRAWPCESGSNPRVSSTRPAFPQLRRSPPIPSLPWLLAADLFRCRSAQVEALPCHSAASRCTSIPSHRCFAVSLVVGSKLCYADSLLLPSTLFRFAALRSAPRLAFPTHVSSLIFRSKPWPFHADRSSSLPRHSVSARVVVCRLAAMPFLFSSFPLSALRLHAPPSQLWSCQSLSVADPVESSPSVSTSMRIVSRPFAALSIRPVASAIISMALRIVAELCNSAACQRICRRAVHGHSASQPRLAFRFHSAAAHSTPHLAYPHLCASHRLHASPFLLMSVKSRPCFALSTDSVSTLCRFASLLFLAFPFPIICAPVSAEPFRRSSILR